MIRIRAAGALVGALALALAGCDDGPKVVKVSGTVTHNGQPVPNLALTFTPAVGRPSWGVTDEEGKYNLQYTTTREGAEVGTHKVTVEFAPANPQEEADLASGKKRLSADRQAILKKYGKGAPSALEIEVPRTGGTLDIKLD